MAIFGWKASINPKIMANMVKRERIVKKVRM